MINIIHHEKIEDERLPVGSTAVVHIFCVQITNVKVYAESLIKEITDTSWISQLDPVAKMSYEIIAAKTVEKLVEIFQAVENEVTKDFGEFMVSLSSGKCLEDKHSHTCLPISELWKEKILGNHGFDFHTISPEDKFSFGESKYQKTGNAYTSAAGQVHDFSKAGKDKADAIHLMHFGSPQSLENLEADRKGYVVSFSLNSDDYSLILNNALKNDDVIALSKRCDELYLIGVSVKHEAD